MLICCFIKNIFMNIKVFSFVIISILLISGCIVTKESSRLFGTVKFDNNIYFDEVEVDVGSWLSYYTWLLEHEGIKSAQKVLPDSNAVEPEVWKYINTKSNIYSNRDGRITFQPIGFYCEKCSNFINYDKWLNPIPESCPFLMFPITGVTYEQAVGFCEWRTKVLGGNKVIYRLPSEKEWIDFAVNGLPEPDKKNRYRDSLLNKKCPTFNFKIKCDCYKENSESKQNGIGRYPAEKSGAFDVYGNVSEMTSKKGISKGGNYKIYANQCNPDSVQYYNKPEVWLGFRCIAVKVDRNRQNIENDGKLIVQSTKTNDSILVIKSNESQAKFADSRDGKIYRTVLIGDQTWMAENLAYKPEHGNYWIYDWDNDNLIQYGYLYSWKTSKDVCPIGWQLPSKNDFDSLVAYVGGNDTRKAYSNLISGGNTDFSMLYGGLRLGLGAYYNSNWVALWSSSLDNDSGQAWVLNFDGNKLEVEVRKSSKSGMIGMPIRCIKEKK